MSKNSSRPVGRHFLHIPGPTPLPDRILRAMDTPIIDQIYAVLYQDKPLLFAMQELLGRGPKPERL